MTLSGTSPVSDQVSDQQADSAPAIMTITPGAGQSVVLQAVEASFAAASSDLLIITDGGTVKFKQMVTNDAQFVWPRGWRFSTNGVVVIRLDTSSTTAYLDAQFDFEN